MNERIDGFPSVCIDLKKCRVRIPKKTLILLRNPEYIELLVNPKKRWFIVRSASNNKNAHHIMINHLPENKQYYELYSSEFIHEIQSLSSTLISFNSYHITGLMNPAGNAAYFSLEKAIVIKSRKDGSNYA